MKVNRACRRRLPCLEHCNNWVKNNHKSLNEMLRDDYRYTKKFESHIDVNMRLLLALTVFVLLCFIVFMIFNLRKLM